MKTGLVWMWISLTGFGISSTDGTAITRREGGQVTVTCTHPYASDNRKYFCRDPCKDKDVLVSSDHSSNGRFSLNSLGNGSFTVTITDLKKSDSGIYWCGVDRVVKDTYNEVKLRVSKADTHTTLRTTTPVTTSDSQTSMSSSFTPSPHDITNSSSFTGPLVVLIAGPVVLMIFGLMLSLRTSSYPENHHDAETIITCSVKPAHDIIETQQQDDTFTVVYFTVSQSPPANHIQDPLLCSSIYFLSDFTKP